MRINPLRLYGFYSAIYKNMSKSKRKFPSVEIACAALMLLFNALAICAMSLYRTAAADITYKEWVSDALYYIREFLYVASRVSCYCAILYCAAKYGKRKAAITAVVAVGTISAITGASLIIDLAHGAAGAILLQMSITSLAFDLLLVIIAFLISLAAQKKRGSKNEPKQKKDAAPRGNYKIFIAAYTLIHAAIRTVEFVVDLIKYDFDITFNECLNVAGSYLYIAFLYGVFSWICVSLFSRIYKRIDGDFKKRSLKQ